MRKNSKLILAGILTALLVLLCGTALAASYPESAHPYESNTDQTWTYTHSTSLTYMKVTFSSDTAFETNWDYLYITDAEGHETRYTGTTLAGKTLYFKGNKITLRLTSDSSGNYYGFRITSIAAATAEEYNTPRYTISNGTITSFQGNVSNLTVPSTVDGETVTAIGSSVFSGMTGLTSVSIPNTVTQIGSNAFNGCTNLKTVKLPTGLTRIENSAFSGCKALTSATIPAGVTEIGQLAFFECESLKTVTFASGSQLARIGYETFYGCKALTAVTIPAGVTELGGYAFGSCESLQTVTFASGSGLNSIGSSVFNGCNALTSVTIPASVTELESYAFQGCESLKTLTFASGSKLNKIGNAAFYACKALTTVSVPSGVTEIGSYAFYECEALKTVAFPSGNTLTTIGSYAFYGCKALTAAAIPAGVTELGDFSFCSCSALKTLSFASGIRLVKIGGYAFNGCRTLTTVTIPASVTEIGLHAFYQCESLKTVTFATETELKTIGNSAFENCFSLTAITIPAGVKEIGDSAFYYCESLKTVKFAAGISLNALGSKVFYACRALQSITLPAGITELPNSAFAWCKNLKSITFKSSGVALGDQALYYCESLTSVDVPITSLGEDALKGCDVLRDVELADSVAALSDNTLKYFKDSMYIVVTAGKNGAVYPQLKSNNICYIVKETGETNQGKLPRDTIRGQVEAIFRERITDGMTDYEKALALHDWLVENAEYDYSMTYYTETGVLLHGTGVCQSYTMAYGLLLDYAGIENASEIGDDHTWNMVLLDGDWYHVDVTWDDVGDYSEYAYFGLSNDAIETVEHHECYTKKHVATSYKYYYWYRNGLLDSYLDEFRSDIDSALEAGQGSVRISSYDGILTRTCILVLRDGTYTAAGRTANMEIDYADGYINATVKMEKPDLVLPASMTTVGAEAFSGIAANVVRIPDKTETIGSKAFSNCQQLWQIEIPESVTTIAADAFSGLKYKLIIYGKAGSTAETFANNNGYGFVEK